MVDISEKSNNDNFLKESKGQLKTELVDGRGVWKCSFDSNYLPAIKISRKRKKVNK